MNDCRSSNVIPVQDSLSQTLFLAKTVCLKRYSCPRQFVFNVSPVEDSLSQTSFLAKTVVSNVIPVQDSLSQTSFLSKTVCLKRHSCPRQFVSSVIPVQDSLSQTSYLSQTVSNVLPVQDSLSQTLYLTKTVCLKRYTCPTQFVSNVILRYLYTFTLSTVSPVFNLTVLSLIPCKISTHFFSLSHI